SSLLLIRATMTAIGAGRFRTSLEMIGAPIPSGTTLCLFDTNRGLCVMNLFHVNSLLARKRSIRSAAIRSTKEKGRHHSRPRRKDREDAINQGSRRVDQRPADIAKIFAESVDS